MLVSALSVRVLNNMYIIIINKFVVANVADFRKFTWWGGQHACVASMHVDYVNRFNANSVSQHC